MTLWPRFATAVAGSGVGFATHHAGLAAFLAVSLASLSVIDAWGARQSRERREAHLLAALPDAARAGVSIDLADVVRAQMGDPPARVASNKARLQRRLGRST